MKSETRIKIKESRQKYFQEVVKQKTAQTVRMESKKIQGPDRSAETPSPVSAAPGLDLRRIRESARAIRPRISPALDMHRIKVRMPEVSMPGFLTLEHADHVMDQIRKPLTKAGKEISATRQRVSNAVNQRTETAISRFNDYMMVIFDA